MSLNEEILRLAGELEPYVIDCRRTIHTYAEVASHEDKTKALIIREAEALGLPYEEVPVTSVIVELDTGRPGKVVALRADIDALPMAECETNLTGPRTCRSEQPDTCHACGHDAHAAMLLGAMRLLTALRDRLCGKVLFCFEEGEEINSGVKPLLDALEKYHVDRCWAIHTYADLEEGKLSIDPGPRMAGGTPVALRFIGQAGHGSRPDLAVNPVFCGASFLNNLCAVFSNQIPAGQTVTMGITVFRGGDAYNIISDTAEIEGSFRFFDMEAGRKAVEAYRRTAEHTAAIFGCQVEILKGGEAPSGPGRGCGPVINDEACAAAAQAALEPLLPAGTLVSCEPWYAGECYCWWLERYPGVLALLGIRNRAEGYGAPHHHDRFDLNEKVLKTGVAATAGYAAQWLAL